MAGYLSWLYIQQFGQTCHYVGPQFPSLVMDQDFWWAINQVQVPHEGICHCDIDTGFVPNGNTNQVPHIAVNK